jgi:hypothetical protein
MIPNGYWNHGYGYSNAALFELRGLIWSTTKLQYNNR